MRYAEERLADHVMNAAFSDSSVDFVMNVTGDYVKDLEEVRHHLIRQVTSPVRWEKSVRSIEERGVDEYVEIGCGKVLAGFNRRIGTRAPTANVEHIEQLAMIERLLT
jgi:[acyl-carrier-protein] S-malonyltransferase